MIQFQPHKLILFRFIHIVLVCVYLVLTFIWNIGKWVNEWVYVLESVLSEIHIYIQCFIHCEYGLTIVHMCQSLLRQIVSQNLQPKSNKMQVKEFRREAVRCVFDWHFVWCYRCLFVINVESQRNAIALTCVLCYRFSRTSSWFLPTFRVSFDNCTIFSSDDGDLACLIPK